MFPYSPVFCNFPQENSSTDVGFRRQLYSYDGLLWPQKSSVCPEEYKSI